MTGRLVTTEFLGALVGTALFATADLLPFGLAAVWLALSALPSTSECGEGDGTEMLAFGRTRYANIT
ncbi:hypothetical protein ACWF9B_24580 [Streptomyces sp. NPDC055089]